MADHPSLDALIALALDAGREVLLVRDRGIDATAKADGSPVTLADKAAEAVIEAGLKALCPVIPMLAEEATSEGRAPVLGPRFFCVDPIDGTRDFVAGAGEYTVNIALVENGAPTMGVVLAPATGALYAGEPGRALRGRADVRAARLESAVAPIAPARDGAWRLISSRHSGRGARSQSFAEAFGPHERAYASSSIKFCRLAEGGADLYPRFGEVHEWDTAAGHAVLVAAGGGVMRLDGAPLTYGHADDHFIVRGFVAYTSADGAEAARAALAKMG